MFTNSCVVRPVWFHFSLRTGMICAPPALVSTSEMMYLREALSDNAFSNCLVLSRAVWVAQLAAVEQPADWTVPSQQSSLLLEQPVCPKRSTAEVPSVSGKRPKWCEAGRLSTSDIFPLNRTGLPSVMRTLF
ncbi:hypothetical protein CHARACLAT_027248 [Characodon lateralis]|uniref:Uncharacterized protein n=1 Tax=Characodon lateralis TaxID=208331 RepID=A0ABU7DWP6_9TELE|nr:hypothetical protein [Characodon lateralis]